MPYTKVIVPANGSSTGSHTFTWDIIDILHYSSKVIVGSSPGSDNFYAGIEVIGVVRATRHTKDQVSHPGGNTLCYTRPKYRKSQSNTTWYTTWSNITSFTST